MPSDRAKREVERIRWRCRRGLLELDIVLARFLEGAFPALGAAEVDAFKRLLELPDNDLWDLISGRLSAGEGAEGKVVAMLRQS